MNVTIRAIELKELNIITEILNQLPEFDAIFYQSQLASVLAKAEHVLLVAEFAGKPVGCKVAYNRYFDGSIYSWLGGVLLPYRNQGIATSLWNELELRAKKKFFQSIRMKTWNKHVTMLRFALRKEFYIIGFTENEY
jgi:GNAT superfamily N-acetyltransferase